MWQLPPIPTLDGLHPLVIHFPIALLLVAPLFVLIGAVLPPRRGSSWHAGGLVLMVLGTIAVFVCVQSGEAAGKLAERSPEINAVLERHSQLAELTSFVFAGLTIVFAAMLGITRLVRSGDRRLATSVLPIVFLILYAGGALLLVNTAHNGGRLVHELGVRAIVAGSTSASSQATRE